MKLSAKKIEKFSKNIKVNSFNCVDSTNTVAKKLAENGADEGTVVTAIKQTAGRGRLGRTFLSKKGGVYFSVVLRPQINPEDTLFVTVAAAVAACRAIEAVSSKKCDIKWVNDIYINGKKVCGILTEGGFNSDGTLNYAILGVGINLFEPKGSFPGNLPLADSVFHKQDKIFFKNRVKERLIAEFSNNFFEIYENLEKKEFIKEYQQRSFLTGKDITYKKDGATYNAKVIEIDDNARLIVKTNTKTEVLSHGEIQITGMEQLAI
ncbi:MAG: biotin--[Clostridia bacterium]|nr:biotin--[acetyl-CoA-carboxylase] ligase [Clostridia bacterium]